MAKTIPDITDDVMAAALCALAEMGVRPDIQELLVFGSDKPTETKPGALKLAIERSVYAYMESNNE